MASNSLRVVTPKTVEYSVSELRQGIATKASNALGYNRLQRSIGPRPLLKALSELEMLPFTTESVNKYKSRMVKTGMYSGTRNFILRGFVSVLLVPTFVTSMKIANATPRELLGGVMLVTSILSAACFVINTIALFAANNLHHGTRRRTKWAASSLPHYEGDIPEYVLDKALKIKETVPEASFSVDYLIEESQDSVKPLPDPFLKVSLKNEEYYIEVWNEEKYEVVV